MVKKILIGVAALVAVVAFGFVGVVATQPSELSFERQITVDAPMEDVTTYLLDLKGVTEWSPWTDRDPELQQTWSDPSTGVGAWYAWQGNEDVGRGKQTILSVESDKVVHELHFLEPFEGISESWISWEPKGDAQTVVHWGYRQDNDAMTKVALVFMDIEEMLSGDFDKGLAKLKPLAERASKQRIDAEMAEAAGERAAEAEADPDPGSP